MGTPNREPKEYGRKILGKQGPRVGILLVTSLGPKSRLSSFWHWGFSDSAPKVVYISGKKKEKDTTCSLLGTELGP